MPDDRTDALLVSIEANDGQEGAWAWAIHRDPDTLLMLRSRSDDADPTHARRAGNLAAEEIGRRLGIPVAIGPSDDESIRDARSVALQID